MLRCHNRNLGVDDKNHPLKTTVYPIQLNVLTNLTTLFTRHQQCAFAFNTRTMNLLYHGHSCWLHNWNIRVYVVSI